MTTESIRVRIPLDTRDRLREHAHDVGRTLASESRLWLEAGAAMAVYTATFDPRSALMVPDPMELEELRASALKQLQLAMMRALPGQVTADTVAGAFAPISSMK